MIRLVHTADWHLGRTLMGWSRDGELADALAALVDRAAAERVDALIVAGDVFDTQNPSEAAEAMLYRTLVELRRRLPDVTVVLVAGNHDPAGRLEAPRTLLAELGVHVVGRVARRDGAIDLDRLLVTIRDRDGGPDVHVLALPYLGPASLPPIDRRAETAGSPVVRAVRRLHEEVIAAARARIGDAPLVLTGHLAIGGAIESEGAERRILIGGEHAVPVDLFPDDVAYVALGHLHRPQAIGRDTVRYAGSLIPLSATERDYEHGVTIVRIEGGEAVPEHVVLPRTVPFLRLPEVGFAPLAEIEAALDGLGFDAETPVERRPFVQPAIRLDGPAPNLKADLDRIARDRPVRLIGHVVDRPRVAEELAAAVPVLDLADCDPEDLFRRAFLRAHGVAPTPAHLEAFALVREAVVEEAP